MSVADLLQELYFSLAPSHLFFANLSSPPSTQNSNHNSIHIRTIPTGIFSFSDPTALTFLFHILFGGGTQFPPCFIFCCRPFPFPTPFLFWVTILPPPPLESQMKYPLDHLEYMHLHDLYFHSFSTCQNLKKKKLKKKLVIFSPLPKVLSLPWLVQTLQGW